MSDSKPSQKTLSDFAITTLGGKKLDKKAFSGKVTLIVNTASKCGYTGQYDGLEKLYQEYKEKGFVVLGFPSNDFGGQEPGSNEEIATFCKRNYGVSFPMSRKVVVKGKKKTDLYEFLTSTAPQTGEVRWNFEKFLIDRKGRVVGRFASSTKPLSDELTKKIEELI